MTILSDLFSYRSHVIALLFLLTISLALTQVPLFNYLGYEYSAVIVVFWSLASGLLTISLWNKTCAAQSEKLSAFAVRSLAAWLTALLLPLVVIALNALLVKNCSFPQGIILFSLITTLGIVFAHALALFCTVVFPRWKKSAFVIIWIGVLAQIAYVGFTGPQIFAFNPIMGYFPGLTYDETLDVNERLLLYRIGTTSAAVFLVLLAVAVHRRRLGLSKALLASLPLQQRAFMALLAVIVLVMFFLSDRLNLASSESSIQEVLGGRIETEHFIVFYPDTMLKGARLEQVVQLHEYQHARLRRALWVRPGRKIQSYLYASAEQKGRLIGAAGTNIAKPWLWQLHMNVADVDASLRHELVHVMAADFGFPLLRIGINSGLIEGLAVAADRYEYEEPIHRLAAMVYATGAAQDMESLFSVTGFMKAPAGVSYTLAGSFCRYLIDRYHMPRFKLLYRTGEFFILYGKPLPRLLQEWRRSLDRFKLSNGDLQKANYLFKRRSIFGKECARVIANLNKETRTLLITRQHEAALASAEESIAKSMSTEAVYQKATALVRLGRYSDAAAFMKTMLSDSTVASSFLVLNSLLGDALWGIDSLESSMHAYGELLRAHLSFAWDESITLRQEIVLNPTLVRALRPYFLSAMEDSVRIPWLEERVKDLPKEPLPKYLLAREQTGTEHYEQAVKILDALSPFDSPILEMARQRRLGQLCTLMGKYQKSKMYYWQSLNHLYRDAQALEMEERLRFADWMDDFRSSMN